LAFFQVVLLVFFVANIQVQCKSKAFLCVAVQATINHYVLGEV